VIDMRGKVDVPLSDDEFDALAERGLDLDRVFGVLHAVLVAPGMISPSRWLPLAFGEVSPDPTSLERVLRLYNEVANALQDGEGYLPTPDDEAGCVAFADGYAAAAALDRHWIDDADRWTFASPIAFLGGRHDLVPPSQRAEFDAHPERRQVLLRDLGGLVMAAYESFAKDRVATAQAASQGRTASPRVGRNDLCPCGSGKKYKRCCIDGPAATAKPVTN
jgi:uncharacterized protein